MHKPRTTHRRTNKCPTSSRSPLVLRASTLAPRSPRSVARNAHASGTAQAPVGAARAGEEHARELDPTRGLPLRDAHDRGEHRRGPATYSVVLGCARLCRVVLGCAGLCWLQHAARCAVFRSVSTMQGGTGVHCGAAGDGVLDRRRPRWPWRLRPIRRPVGIRCFVGFFNLGFKVKLHRSSLRST